MTTPAAAAWPTRIGKYELREPIGRGDSGIVCRGYDPFVQREVAVKFAFHDPSHRHDADHERAFFAEARAAGALQHPNIVALYDAGVEGEISYLVMEYVDGQTLRPHCRADGARLPVAQVLDIGSRCALALDYAHERGVLHRDIKPGNIMLMRDGTPKLMDFSLAEFRAEPGTKMSDGRLRGSPYYMAPEQVRGDGASRASDLYALGAVLYQLLCGAPPFAQADRERLFEDIRNRPAPDLAQRRAGIAPAVAALVARLLDKAPDRRFVSGRALAAALAPLIEAAQGPGVDGLASHDALRRLEIFAGFSVAAFDELLAASRVVSCAADGRWPTAGPPAMLIILRGELEWSRDGRTQRFAAGDGVDLVAAGEAALRARTRVLALRVDLRRLEQASADTQLRFYRAMTAALSRSAIRSAN
ncbi:serine/threonine-protein kinase [Solimonas marina]|uniref:Serine/threonine protein kinase n=1 Tax=Solimonas marina TaxID=2714601 RepID=A0A970B6E8_9GAMM|nr:serine/threonine-protein kinase [Solimonas marina]NKF22718.1 serine/threonine protein kinase [Solimonas marina]